MLAELREYAWCGEKPLDFESAELVISYIRYIKLIVWTKHSSPWLWVSLQFESYLSMASKFNVHSTRCGVTYLMMKSLLSCRSPLALVSHGEERYIPGETIVSNWTEPSGDSLMQKSADKFGFPCNNRTKVDMESGEGFYFECKAEGKRFHNR